MSLYHHHHHFPHLVRFMLLLSSVCLALSPSFASPVAGAEQAPHLSAEQAYQRFFEEDVEELETLFAEPFLRVVSVKKLEGVRSKYLESLGRFKRAQKEQDQRYLLIFERGVAPSTLSIQGDQVSALWFGVPLPSGDQRVSLRKRLKMSEGVTAALITLNHDEVLFEHNAHLPLSVGSAFKLFVLKALLEEVESGRRSMSEVLTLNDKGRSLPTGVLQDWPIGTPVTLGTLATLMISRSDNTATDHLIHALGKRVIERHTPVEMRPLLTTREAFLLKWGARVELRAEFEDADEAERRQLLRTLEGASLSEVKPHVNPIAIQEIEWRASAVELCEVLWALRAQAILSMNTGLTSVEGTIWDRVAFKGGSEPGVLSYAHLLTSWDPSPQQGADPKGMTACVVSMINHPSKQVDADFTELSQSLIAQATQVVRARRAGLTAPHDGKSPRTSLDQREAKRPSVSEERPQTKLDTTLQPGVKVRSDLETTSGQDTRPDLERAQKHEPKPEPKSDSETQGEREKAVISEERGDEEPEQAGREPEQAGREPEQAGREPEQAGREPEPEQAGREGALPPSAL